MSSAIERSGEIICLSERIEHSGFIGYLNAGCINFLAPSILFSHCLGDQPSSNSQRQRQRLRLRLDSKGTMVKQFASVAVAVAAATATSGALMASAATARPQVAVSVLYHSPVPVLSSANQVGHGKPPEGCIVFNPAYIPASSGLNSSGLLVRMCCGSSCIGHGDDQVEVEVEDEATESAERIGFAPCDLVTGVCEDVLPNFNLDPSVDTEDPRAFMYNGLYYNFYYRGSALPGTKCEGSSCTVALAKTKTPLDATSWEPVATLNWHRNGCCVMNPKGQKSYCMWGEGPSPFPGLGLSYTTDIDSGEFTQVPWMVDDNTTAPVSADRMWMLPLGADQSEIKLEAGTHMVRLSTGNLFTFYAAATPGWVANGNYTV